MPRPLPPTGRVVYVVQRDDTLQGIAGRFLGDPAAWPAIFALNRGSARLPDGRTLTHPDLIWPGLPIVLPHAVSGAGPPAADPAAVGSAGEVAAPSADVGGAAPEDSVAPAAPTLSDVPLATTLLAEPPPAPEDGLWSEVAGGALAPNGGDASSIGGQAPDQPATGEGAAPEHGPAVAASPRAAVLDATAAAVVVATGAAVAGVGAAAVVGARRLRRRRRLGDLPVSLESLVGAPGVVTLAGGFATAEFERALADRTRHGELAPDDAEPATAGAGRVSGVPRRAGCS